MMMLRLGTILRADLRMIGKVQCDERANDQFLRNIKFDPNHHLMTYDVIPWGNYVALLSLAPNGKYYHWEY